MQVTYYIKHPNGRQKLGNHFKNDEEAMIAFNNHWSAKAHWINGGKRVLVKEVKQEIFVEEIQ